MFANFGSNILSGSGIWYRYDTSDNQILVGSSAIADNTGTGWSKLSSQISDGFYNLTVHNAGVQQTVLLDTYSGHFYTYDGSNLYQDGDWLFAITPSQWAALESQAT